MLRLTFMPMAGFSAHRWYQVQSSHAWGPEKPSLQETRTHAKCLRSVSSVRDYFREYRAKKKHVRVRHGRATREWALNVQIQLTQVGTYSAQWAHKQAGLTSS